jgi:DNA-binding CsgD family transcriptional regulator
MNPGHQMDLAEFSTLVLSLSSMQRDASVENVQDQVLKHIQAFIPFNSAWWGVGAARSQKIDIYQSFLYELPPAFFKDWTDVAKSDHLAFKVFSRPGTAVLGKNGDRSLEIIRFCKRYDIHSTLSIGIPDPAGGLGLFISLYRSQDSAPFNEQERKLFQLLAPHIAAAWRGSWRDEASRGHKDRDVCYALVSKEGVLRNADPAFCRWLLTEWPAWGGTLLPDQVQLVTKTKKEFRGKHIEIRFKVDSDCGGAMLSCSPRSAISLTPREESIARQYASGLSYKEIARQFNLSPETVRSYLRDSYLKLGVSNKCQLGAAINIRNSDVMPAPGRTAKAF